MVHKNVVIFDRNTPLHLLWQQYCEVTPDFFIFKANTVVLEGPEMNIFFEINSQGLKGPELDPSKKLIAIWGASIVAGIGRGWVDDIASFFPGTQFVNGGVPKNNFTNIYNFAFTVNQQNNFHANVLMARDLSLDNETFRKSLIYFVERIPNTILCTIATPVGDELSKIDLRPYAVKSDPQLDALSRADIDFHIDEEFSDERNRKSKIQVNEQNQIIREVASEKGLPLIDVYPHFETNDPEHLRDHFSDCTHFRPSAYPKLQKIMAEELKNVI